MIKEKCCCLALQHIYLKLYFLIRATTIMITKPTILFLFLKWDKANFKETTRAAWGCHGRRIKKIEHFLYHRFYFIHQVYKLFILLLCVPSALFQLKMTFWLWNEVEKNPAYKASFASKYHHGPPLPLNIFVKGCKFHQYDSWPH